MDKQVPVDADAVADDTERDGVHEIAPDLAYQRLAIVNLMYYGTPGAGDGRWVLIDAGIPGSAGTIAGVAEHRFGKDSRPAAIVLTHGHFDHVGALADLAERWDVPVYAHELELPYLDGRSSYLHGPPMYYTPDWEQARASVERLSAIDPELAVTGHGPALSGPEMRQALHTLARDFERVAVPKHGRYVHEPARADESGVTYVPPKEG
ncbi:MAG: MBL fold metallo-hydrolase [Gemmatimonadaceae bacterium]